MFAPGYYRLISWSWSLSAVCAVRDDSLVISTRPRAQSCARVGLIITILLPRCIGLHQPVIQSSRRDVLTWKTTSLACWRMIRTYLRCHCSASGGVLSPSNIDQIVGDQVTGWPVLRGSVLGNDLSRGCNDLLRLCCNVMCNVLCVTCDRTRYNVRDIVTLIPSHNWQVTKHMDKHSALQYTVHV